MRQAGIIAAAGIVALETMIDRLKEDHANARRLAEGVNHLPGFSVNIASVESNMLRVDSSRTGKTIEDWQVCFKKYDVLVGNYPDCLRFVTHRHHTPEIIDEALRRMRKAVEK